jgi:acetyl-CoA/propionyl-CoA carboxylase, biotin carboxylase, biotin carboxyl carrier protein
MTVSTRTEGRLFDSVLVANRGEIACRIIRTLRALGVRSIAVYSDADRGAKHVGLADDAVRIGPAEPRRSYLNVDAVVAAAVASGAQAVHPGYGFLSENADFARACSDAGLVFIGPGEEALSLMGDKIRAKQHVVAHGVATTPGIAEPGLDDDALIAAAGRIGYPVLIKPSAGGGGKGMYAVQSADELPDSLIAARRIANAAFGDGTLFIERLVQAPRHIEVQVLADRTGHTIHLGERECSLQRRHQKVVEEAPSPLLSAQTRARIGEAACAVARSVGYVGAGTVEFLVSDASPDEFFFMEMNTRLQVEHPVTEMVTGVDIVEWQVRIAAGQALTLRQDDIVLSGHAVEARVYAEDPRQDFLPQAGRVIALHEAAGEGIRVDSSLVPGLVIPPDYDPMLAKVIAWGEDRSRALARLERALADTVVLGVHTNVEYLAALLAEPAVQAAELDTGLIERTLPGVRFRDADDELVTASAAWLHAIEWRNAPDELWTRPTGWRSGDPRPVRYSLAADNELVADADLTGSPDAASVRIGWSDPVGHPGAGHFVSVAEAVGASTRITVDGTSRRYWIARDELNLWVADRGAVFELGIRDRAVRLAEQLAALATEDGPADPQVRSPMPGTVVSVDRATGDEVRAGDTILTVEAMKMEHRLLAPVTGTVTVSVRATDLVKAGQLVASVAPSAGPSAARPQAPSSARPEASAGS